MANDNDMSKDALQQMLSEDEEEIKSLLASDLGTSQQETSIDNTLKRIRSNIGQRDTILFVFVKIWTAAAKILAPIFAFFASRKNNVKQQTPKKLD